MTHSLNYEPMTTSVCVSGTSADGLRHLSSDQFRQFGLPLLAYLSERTARDGSMTYAIHAADGTELVSVDELDAAVELANLNKIILVAMQ
jgi:hypothetical protein